MMGTHTSELAAGEGWGHLIPHVLPVGIHQVDQHAVSDWHIGAETLNERMRNIMQCMFK